MLKHDKVFSNMNLELFGVTMPIYGLGPLTPEILNH